MAPLLAMLAQAGLPLLVQAITNKGQEFVEEKLGVKIDLLAKSEEGLIRLKQLEMEHEQFLLGHVLETSRLDLERQALEDKDRASARDMNARIQESSNASAMAKDAAYYIDFAIVGGVLTLGLMLFFKAIPPENQDMAQIVFGSLLTLAITVVNFHRGSSRGSETKQSTIDFLAKGGVK